MVRHPESSESRGVVIAENPFEYVRVWNQLLADKGWWHSFELPDGRLIEGVCELSGLKNRLAQFSIPLDLQGKRVLDIGAWDGWFSFEMERRGAEVVAVDCWDNPKFRQMHAWLGSRVEYRTIDVYDLDPNDIGTFDIVLFLGVLYHLKHPLLALEKVCALTRGMAAVDSFVLKEEYRPGSDVDHRPIMEFYENDEMGGQTDNWVGPSVQCLMAMCRTAGFARVHFINRLEHSACLMCYRDWECIPENASAPPKLLEAFHHTNFGINFSARKDDYLSCWFSAVQDSISIQNVKPTVGAFGVRPIRVDRLDAEHWQTNFKLPPGLKSGWHDVRIRVGDSEASGARRIAVDIDPGSPELLVKGVADGTTWRPNEIDLSAGDTLSLWIQGLPGNADRNNLSILLDGQRLRVVHIEVPRDSEPRQVNAQIAGDFAAGPAELTVSIGCATSPSVTIRIAG